MHAFHGAKKQGSPHRWQGISTMYAPRTVHASGPRCLPLPPPTPIQQVGWHESSSLLSGGQAPSACTAGGGCLPVLCPGRVWGLYLQYPWFHSCPAALVPTSQPVCLQLMEWALWELVSGPRSPCWAHPRGGAFGGEGGRMFS
jgi:hypothetical protein